MRKRIYLVPLKSVLGRSILHYSQFYDNSNVFHCTQDCICRLSTINKKSKNEFIIFYFDFCFILLE